MEVGKLVARCHSKLALGHICYSALPGAIFDPNFLSTIFGS